MKTSPSGSMIFAFPGHLHRGGGVAAADAAQDTGAGRVIGEAGDRIVADRVEPVEIVELESIGLLVGGERRRGAGQIGVDLDLAADPMGLLGREVDRLVIVQNRRDDWPSAADSRNWPAPGTIAAQVEIAPVALAVQIHGRRGLAEHIAGEGRDQNLVRNAIVVKVPLVGQTHHVPAEFPVLAEPDRALGGDRTAVGFVPRAPGLGREGAVRRLMNAVDVEVEIAVVEPVAEIRGRPKGPDACNISASTSNPCSARSPRNRERRIRSRWWWRRRASASESRIGA